MTSLFCEKGLRIRGGKVTKISYVGRDIAFFWTYTSFFYLGEPARLRGRRFQALQTHTHDPTWGNVVPSRRAVGLSATMILAQDTSSFRSTRSVERNLELATAHHPRQNHFRFNPSRAPVRTISLFRGAPPNSLARNFSPRRDPSDPDQPVGNGNASVPGYQPPQS